MPAHVPTEARNRSYGAGALSSPPRPAGWSVATTCPPRRASTRLPPGKLISTVNTSVEALTEALPAVAQRLGGHGILHPLLLRVVLCDQHHQGVAEAEPGVGLRCGHLLEQRAHLHVLGTH